MHTPTYSWLPHIHSSDKGNILIIYKYLSTKNISCRCSAFNEYPKHMFSGEIIKTFYQYFFYISKAHYLDVYEHVHYGHIDVHYIYCIKHSTRLHVRPQKLQ